MVVLSLVVSSPAFATTGYAFSGQFGGAGNGPGEFASAPQGIAIRQSTSDVFVSDPGHTLGDGSTPDPRVERFDVGGVFESAFSIEAGYRSPQGLAVDPAGSVYVAVTDASSSASAVLKYSTGGVFAYALDVSGSGIVIDASAGGGAGVAVDPVSGDVYVLAVDSGAHVVAVFDGITGGLIGSIDGSSSPEAGFSCPSSLAVDGASRLYVGDSCKGRVDRYSTGGVFDGVVDDGSRGTPFGVSADPVSNEVFVAELGSAGWLVTQFSAGGLAVGPSFGWPQITGFVGLAVDHSSDAVYVADYEKMAIERFGTFEGPTVTTTTGVSIDPTSAVLNGTIDPGGIPSTYHFEYGPDKSYGAQTAESDPITSSGEILVTATVAGLQPNTTYHYRSVGTNASGSITGNDQTFTTQPAAPPFASAITTNAATLNAILTPNGYDTTYHFEYGTTTAYGKTTPEADAGSGNGEVTVSQPTGPLAPATTYHIRIVATSNGLTTIGDDTTFTTGKLPLAVLAYPTAISASEATLAGMIDTHGTDGSYTFHIESLDSPYSTTIARLTPAGEGMQPVTARLAGLPAGETFGVVLSVTSNQVTTSDSTVFSTPPQPKRPDRPAPNAHCTAPTLNPHTHRPQPGQTITLTGRDLGTDGTATLNSKQISPRRWTPTRVSVQIPKRATGTLPLTIDCGHRSNAIALEISTSNKFTITNTKTNGQTATLTLKLPGPGKIRTTSHHTTPKTTRIAKAGTTTIKTKLTNTATNTLANAGRLKTPIHVRYTPNGGQPNTKTTTLFFKRAAAKARN